MMSMDKIKMVEQITVLTVYDKKESKTYLMRDWEKFGDKAPAIKHITYDKSPVIRMDTIAAKPESVNGVTNNQDLT